MMLEIVLAFLIFLFIWDYSYKQRKEKLFKSQGILGPNTLPFLGNALITIQNNTIVVFDLLTQLCDEYNKTFRMWFMHEPVIFTRDVHYFESVLSSQEVIKKNILYDMLVAWLGEGLLISSGSKWYARRKIITPTFHFKILEQFVEVFDQQSAVMVDRLHPRANGQSIINLFPVVCLTALDIITETAMGVEINAQMNPDLPYVKALTDAASILATRFTKASQRYDFLFKIVAPRNANILYKSIEIMHTFTDKVIKDRRAALQTSIVNGNHQAETGLNDVGQKRRLAFLDVLLQSTFNGKPLSNSDIREEVDTFMFEGHDTTTSGISFILYLISRHPEVQQKLFREICDVIGNDNRKPIAISDLHELKYLECVIKEGMRMYPPVPIIGRIVEQDTIINGKMIPKGTNISLLIFAALRDPDYFTKPNEFIPERFDANSDVAHKINPFAYVPFSAGPRNCIGQKFAMLEMKSTISKMLRHFELLPLGEELVPMMNLVMRSANGVNVGLTPRVY